MKKLIKNVTKLGGACVVGVLILSLINCVYGYTGIHIDNETGATDYVWESNQIKTNLSEGFSWLRMDENGFNNTSENVEKMKRDDLDILLMGSSHMEALQVAEDENTGYLLNNSLPDKSTYNIGISGHDIYRVVDNVDNAVLVYQPEEYLVIETATVILDEDEMKQVIEGTAKKIPSYDSGLIYYLQKIPAIKWLYKNVQDWISQSELTFAKKETTSSVALGTVDDVDTHTYDETLAEFLDIVSGVCEKQKCTPIIFYHPEAVILENGDWDCSTDNEYLDVFEAVCAQKNIIFEDMTKEFYKVYNEQELLAHGFINTDVNDAHLNEVGHKIIAEKLVEVIKENEKGMK